MKKGVNLYQDVTIPAEVSKDGQVHTTQTKEELRINITIWRRRVRYIMRLIEVRNTKDKNE